MMKFNDTYTQINEDHHDIKGLSNFNKRGIHPIQALLDYGYQIVPGKHGIITDPDGIAHDMPDLYDMIINYLKEKRRKR